MRCLLVGMYAVSNKGRRLRALEEGEGVGKLSEGSKEEVIQLVACLGKCREASSAGRICHASLGSRLILLLLFYTSI